MHDTCVKLPSMIVCNSHFLSHIDEQHTSTMRPHIQANQRNCIQVRPVNMHANVPINTHRAHSLSIRTQVSFAEQLFGVPNIFTVQ